MASCINVLAAHRTDGHIDTIIPRARRRMTMLEPNLNRPLRRCSALRRTQEVEITGNLDWLSRRKERH
jgi:hypothetical protein